MRSFNYGANGNLCPRVTTFLVFPMPISICNQYQFCRHIQSWHGFTAVLSDAINPLEMDTQNCNVACDVADFR